MLPMYSFTKKFGGIEGGKVLDFMKRSAHDNISASKVYSTLQGTALGYRKKDLLEDYRRVRATELSHTWGGKERAEWWYENIFGKKQKETGWSSEKTMKWLKRGELGLIEETKEQKEYDLLEKQKEDEFTELYR